MASGGRVFDAGLELLDRQILDKDQLFAGKVDDLELVFPPDGGPPFVTAILVGPGALSRRLSGRVGSWIESLHVRLHPREQPGPARISFGVVKEIGNHIDVSVAKRDLDINLFEEWVRKTIISKIPGAADAPQ
jgi:hypothetical protein